MRVDHNIIEGHGSTISHLSEATMTTSASYFLVFACFVYYVRAQWDPPGVGAAPVEEVEQEDRYGDVWEFNPWPTNS